MDEGEGRGGEGERGEGRGEGRGERGEEWKMRKGVYRDHARHPFVLDILFANVHQACMFFNLTELYNSLLLVVVLLASKQD